MKSAKLAAAMALVMGFGLVSNASAMTAGGVITFNGIVNDETCTVTGGAGTDGGTGNFSVSLDPAGASELAAAGATAQPKVFDVIIGGVGQGTCEDGKTAKMSFLTSSTQIDPVTGALKNVLVGEAKNVQIQLADAKGAAINLAVPGTTYDAKIGEVAPNTGKVQFKAQYLAVGGPAAAGLVNTNVVYSVVYN